MDSPYLSPPCSPPPPPPPPPSSPLSKKLKMSTTSTTSDDDENPKTTTAVAAPRKQRFKRRKIAIFVTYCGVGYQGMQKNPGAKTIEGDLEDALFFSGAVPAADRGLQKSFDWTRSARTDKGVSAVGQVVSGRFYIEPPGLVSRLNSHLPPQIRILGYKRVTASFNAKKFCDRRRYVYLLPVFALDPNAHPTRESVLASMGSENELVKCSECPDRGRKVPGVMGRRGGVSESNGSHPLEPTDKIHDIESTVESRASADANMADVEDGVGPPVAELESRDGSKEGESDGGSALESRICPDERGSEVAAMENNDRPAAESENASLLEKVGETERRAVAENDFEMDCGFPCEGGNAKEIEVIVTETVENNDRLVIESENSYIIEKVEETERNAKVESNAEMECGFPCEGGNSKTIGVAVVETVENNDRPVMESENSSIVEKVEETERNAIVENNAEMDCRFTCEGVNDKKSEEAANGGGLLDSKEEEVPLKGGEFEYGEKERERFNRILKYYVGTHNFHNFTTRTKAEDPSARRFIVSFTADNVVNVDGIEFVRCEVVGQSFMLHQIRKMIGLAVAVMRNCAPESLMERALRQDVHVNVPTAPEVGLYLDECLFSSYNQKWKDSHEELSLDAYMEQAEDFKMKHIFSHVASMEQKEGVVGLWLHSLNNRNYSDFRFSEANETQTDTKRPQEANVENNLS